MLRICNISRKEAGVFKSLGVMDICVIILYIISMICIGIYVGKRVQSSKDFTSAGQKMSLGVVIGSTVATCLGSSIAFGNLELVHEYGLSGLTSGLFWYVGWMFLVLLARPLRNSGATSIPTFLATRYNENTRKISSLCTIIMALSSCAANFIAIGVMTQALGICDATTGTIVGAVIIVLFTIFSGLWGVAITDTIQSVILVIGIGIIVPYAAFSEAGGFSFVMANTAPIRLDPFLGMAPLTMLGWFLANSLACGAHPAYAQRIFAAKDTKTAQRGTLISNLICVCVMVVAALPAFCIPFLFPDMQVGSEFAPRFIAGFFPPLLAINRYIVAGSTVIIVIMGLYWNSIYALFKIGASAYGAGMFLPLLLGCFWKKANTKAINIGMFTGCMVSFLWDYLLKRHTGIDGVILGAGLCLVICVGGSLLLRAHKEPSHEAA